MKKEQRREDKGLPLSMRLCRGWKSNRYFQGTWGARMTSLSRCRLNLEQPRVPFCSGCLCFFHLSFALHNSPAVLAPHGVGVL
jgi:hypothetical protein